MGGLKFGGGSMGALGIWSGNAYKEQLAKRQMDAEIDAKIKMARAQAEIENELNPDRKYNFEQKMAMLAPGAALNSPEFLKKYGIDFKPQELPQAPEGMIYEKDPITGRLVAKPDPMTNTAAILSREKMNQEDNDRAYNLAMLKAASGGGGGGAAYASLAYRMQKDAEDRAIKAVEKQDEEKKYAKETWRKRQMDVTKLVTGGDAYKRAQRDNPKEAEKMLSRALSAEWKKTDTDIKKYFKRKETVGSKPPLGKDFVPTLSNAGKSGRGFLNTLNAAGKPMKVEYRTVDGVAVPKGVGADYEKFFVAKVKELKKLYPQAPDGAVVNQAYVDFVKEMQK